MSVVLVSLNKTLWELNEEIKLTTIGIARTKDQLQTYTNTLNKLLADKALLCDALKSYGEKK